MMRLALALAAGCLSARADDLHVPADFPTIHAAIAAARAGDRVLVAPGDYPEHLEFPDFPLHVLSTHGPEVTTLSGDAEACTLLFPPHVPDSTIVEGFTLRALEPASCPDSLGNLHVTLALVLGSSPTLRHCRFEHPPFRALTLIDPANARVEHASFIEGEGGIGGTFFLSGGHASIADSNFEGAHATTGGQIYVIDAALDIQRSSFVAGMACFGGSIAGEHASFTIADSAFHANSSMISGGVLHLAESSAALFSRCTIDSNQATEAGGFAHVTPGCSLTLDACLVADNQAPGGGAIFTWPGALASALASTFCGNDEPHVVGPFTDLGKNAFSSTCPAPCRPDCELDTDLDLFDFLCFLGRFADLDPYADFDADADWDIFDFLAFQSEFAAGC